MADAKLELERIYHRRFDADLEYRNRVWKILVRDFFSKYYGPQDHVLDLGCGYGQFINNVECAQRYAMDLNPESRRMLAGEVRFLEQDCSAPWQLASGSLDLVFTSNFLEHLPSKDHVSRTLEEAHRCLRTGGRLVALGPNVKYVGGRYWDFFDHHVPLTELSLQEGLETAGFDCTKVLPQFLPYTMVNAPKYPLRFVSWYLQAPILWRWFGGQFLLVAQRGGNGTSR